MTLCEEIGERYFMHLVDILKRMHELFVSLRKLQNATRLRDFFPVLISVHHVSERCPQNVYISRGVR